MSVRVRPDSTTVKVTVERPTVTVRPEKTVAAPVRQKTATVEVRRDGAVVRPVDKPRTVEVIQRGPPGPTGDPGPRGPAGPPGALSVDATDGEILEFNEGAGEWRPTLHPRKFYVDGGNF